MRRVRYNVAASLDGYIAGPRGEYDWIPTDASIDFAALRADPGEGEIWLFGGGALFASLLAAGQVDAVEVTVAPVLLGGGVPLLPPGRMPAGAPRTALALTGSRAHPSGMVSLTYAVAQRDA